MAKAQNSLTKTQQNTLLKALARAEMDDDRAEVDRINAAYPGLLDYSSAKEKAEAAREVREDRENDLLDALNAHDAERVLRLMEAHPELLNKKYEKVSLFADIVNTAQQWLGLGDFEAEAVNGKAYDKLVLHLLEKNAPFLDAAGNTILHKLDLHSAIQEGFTQAQAKTGIDINARNKLGETPLLRQISDGGGLVDHLLNHPEVDIAAQDNAGDTALHRAAALENAHLVRELVDRLPVNALNHAGETPLKKLMARRGNPKLDELGGYPAQRHIADALMQRGGLVDMQHPAGNVPLIKNLALDFAVNAPDGVALFDKIVWELKNLETKISRRLPKEENSAEFKAFAEVIAKAHAFAKAFDPRHPKQISMLLTDAIERTDGTWQKVSEALESFSKADCAGTKDMVRGFVQSVVLPEIAQRTKNRAGRIDYNKIVNDLIPEIAPILIADRPLLTMLKLSRAWHQRLPVLDDARSVRRTGSWEKAADDFTASNGYVVTFLDNAEKLTREGDTMHHCVGGYAEKCKNEGSHIASIRRIAKDGDSAYQAPVSTVEFSEHPGADAPLQVLQHLGPYNAAPLSDAPETVALQEFLAKTKADYTGKDKITLDFDRIHKRHPEPASDDVKGMIGYDPFAGSAPDKQDEYFKLYLDINTASGRTNSFVPGGNSKWANKTAEDFLLETKIMDKVLKIAESPPLLTQRGRPWP